MMNFQDRIQTTAPSIRYEGDLRPEQAGIMQQSRMPVGRMPGYAEGGDDENEADVRDIPMDDSFRVIDDDVSTGKVGKKDKGSYQKAYKLALKKYQIHSADELDTPAERKGFTAYVDKLWKGGEVKDHALESEMNEKRRRPKKKNRNKNKKNKAKRDQDQ